MSEIVGFSEDGARRIVKQTIENEQRFKNIPPDRKRIITGFNESWAIIGDSTNEKYSFQSIEPQEDHTQTVNEDWLDGTHDSTAGYAIEVRYQSRWVPKDEVVKLRPTVNQDYYIFEVSERVRVGYLDKDGTVTAADGTTDGSGELKFSVTEYDSSSETSTTHASDSTSTVTVFNYMSDSITSDGTNDLKVFYQFGDGGKFWVTGVDCV